MHGTGGYQNDGARPAAAPGKAPGHMVGHYLPAAFVIKPGAVNMKRDPKHRRGSFISHNSRRTKKKNIRLQVTQCIFKRCNCMKWASIERS